MAAIAHIFVEQNTAQAMTDVSYTDIPGAVIASGNFTVGKKYLLRITAQHFSSGSAQIAALRVVHGSTAFDDSETTALSSGTNDISTYAWFTVWTAVTGEAIKLQQDAGGGTTHTIDQIAMLSINLSDDLIESTDWFFAERTTDDALSTSYVDGASITFTPSGASDWMVLGLAQVTHVNNTTAVLTRLSRSGETSSTLPESQQISAANITHNFIHTVTRAYALSTVSNTFKEQSAVSTGTAETRLYSAIFALNLNKFRNHSIAYTEDGLALDTTAYGNEIQSVNLTPSVVSDVVIESYWIFDKNSSANEARFRVQVDNTDQPTGQTTDDYLIDQYFGSGEQQGLRLMTMAVDVATSAHTIDLDASVSATTNTPTANQRSIIAFTMELAVGGDPDQHNPFVKILFKAA